MHVRGAGLIGATAGYGMYLAISEATPHSFDFKLKRAAIDLKETRPTAANLESAVERQLRGIKGVISVEEKKRILFETAEKIADEDAESGRMIGQHGLGLIENISKERGLVNILTHCNAGWLAFVDYYYNYLFIYLFTLFYFILFYFLFIIEIIIYLFRYLFIYFIFYFLFFTLLLFI